tara:strand:- start:39 stop:458 length:420 start_codon:yes stop_codon:yes gene_type:complete
MATQLQGLAKRIPPAWIQTKGSFNARYVSHANITQMILATLGPTSQRVEQIIYNGDTITGVLLTMTFVIDGVSVDITESGDCERPDPDNNGRNLANCISTAYKRCCMRTGKALQCWCDDDEMYILDKVLNEREGQYEEV